MDRKCAMSLLMAVESGHRTLVEIMLEDNPHIADDNTGNFRPEHACLHVTCQRGFVEIAKLLLERGASLERTSHFEDFSPSTTAQVFATPLHCASKYGFAKTVSFLIEKGANVKTRVNGGFFAGLLETALELACDGAVLDYSKVSRSLELEREDHNHAEVARLLLKAGAILEESLVSKMCNPECERQNLEMARVFFQHETKTATSTDRVTFLHVACTFGCMVATLRLLHENADIHAETSKAKAAIHLACEFGHFPIVQVLLNKGASMEGKDTQGWTPLHWASAKGHVDIVEMLLDQGADIEAEQRHGWTPLQLACQNDEFKTARLLVGRGSNVQASGTAGWTPLHIACKFGSLKLARFLLGEGAELYAITKKKDWTPLHVACRHGRLEMVVLLLDQGAYWNWLTEEGTSPEQLAQKYNHVDVVEKDHISTKSRLLRKYYTVFGDYFVEYCF